MPPQRETKFFIYYDAHGSHVSGRVKIALEYDGKTHSLDELVVNVPTFSVNTGFKIGRFRMSGLAASIEIVGGKAVIS